MRRLLSLAALLCLGVTAAAGPGPADFNVVARARPLDSLIARVESAEMERQAAPAPTPVRTYYYPPAYYQQPQAAPAYYQAPSFSQGSCGRGG